MAEIYLMYFTAGIISLALWRKPRLAAITGFLIPSAISAWGAWSFFFHMGGTATIEVPFPLMAARFTLDPLSCFFSFVICLVSMAACLYGFHYSREYEQKGGVGTMAFFFNLFIVSMLLVVSAAHIFWFMIFWELMTFVSYFLIWFNDSKKTSHATILYMIVAHVGGTLILTGFLLLYTLTQSLNFESFAGVAISPVMACVVFLLFFIGFGAKAGVFPVHVWLPEAHPAAPSHVSALMSAVMIKTAIYGIIRICTWLPVQEWWGILIIITGALSALLGVLYALVQNETKAFLAYSSVENIGIILLGLGTGVYGLALGNMILSAAGFLGCLYQVLSHATFKGLLFLGAGSVIHSTGSHDMEVLGGLVKKMPLTAVAFLVGSMAICALPPLNGFASEWLTYQSMITGIMGGGIKGMIVFPMAILALALTGSLAVMCFVKVYSVIFTGVPRDKKIWERATEVPWSMQAGMYILVVCCLVLGIGAPLVAEKIMVVVTSICAPTFVAVAGTCLVSPLGSLVSPALILILMVSMVTLPVLLTVLFKGSHTKARKTDPWVCGFKYSTRMQMTASPFTGATRTLMNWLYRSEVTFEETDKYFGPVKYSNHPRDIWWEMIYKTIGQFFCLVTKKSEIIQNGRMQIYASYVLLVFAILIIIAMYA